jgi:hypothetical protein
MHFGVLKEAWSDVQERERAPQQSLHGSNGPWERIDVSQECAHAARFVDHLI